MNPGVAHGLTNITGLVARQRSSKQLPVYRHLRRSLHGKKPEVLDPQRQKMANPTDQAKADFEKPFAWPSMPRRAC